MSLRFWSRRSFRIGVLLLLSLLGLRRVLVGLSIFMLFALVLPHCVSESVSDERWCARWCAGSGCAWRPALKRRMTLFFARNFKPQA